MLNVTERETSNVYSFMVYDVIKKVEGLHPFYTYDVHIATVTIDAGPYSEPFTVQTKEAGDTRISLKSLCTVYVSCSPPAPSAAPTAVTIQDVGSTHVNISWQPPPVEHQNGVIRLYQLTLTLHSSITDMEDLTFHTALAAIDIPDLLPHHNYTFVLSAVTLVRGPESAVFRFQTLEDGMYVHVPSFAAHMNS